MPTFAFGGWSFGVGVHDLLNEARMYARDRAHTHLGTTAAERNQLIAEYMNRAVEAFLEACPVLGQTTTTQALTANTATYSVPTDLHGLAIAQVQFNDSGSSQEYDLKAIDYLTPAGVEQLPATWRNGTVTAERPYFWAYNGDRTSYVLYPTPSSSSITVQLVYRQEPGATTADNITTTSTTVDSNSAASQTVLNVAATTGYAAGEDVLIGGATARREIKTIDSIQDGVSLTMTANLDNAHTAAQADVVQPVIAEVPRRFQTVLALHMARHMIEPANIDRRWELEAEYSSGDPAVPGELEKAQMIVLRQLGWMQPGRQETRASRIYDTPRLFASFKRNRAWR